MTENNYNDFCMYCTGNDKEEVDKCNDINCPYYTFKHGDNFDEDIKE